VEFSTWSIIACFAPLLYGLSHFSKLSPQVSSKDYLNRVAEGSHNVDQSGNFSIEVLRAVLRSQYGLDLPNIRQEGILDVVADVTQMEGFICNKQAHWFAIRLINGRFWNLNSMKEQPEIISHFNLAKEIQSLQDDGYSVFVVPFGLPPPCTSAAQRSRGKPEFWWRELDLVNGKGSASINGSTDPWKGVGAGQRLDGRAGLSNHDLDDLTEDEMLQMALAASMDPAVAPAKDALPALAEEPPAGSQTVRIQFRLPGGGRAVRRFLTADPVKMLYSFVDHEAKDGQGRNLELRFGFPPKDLLPQANKTIGETSLAGENIQCRWL
jgi:ataxin-3